MNCFLVLIKTRCALVSEQWLGGFNAPFVKESEIKIGLTYKQHQILLNETVMVIGEVICVQCSSIRREDGAIDIESLGSVAVSGLDTDHTTEKIKRLSYAKIDKKPETLG